MTNYNIREKYVNLSDNVSYLKSIYHTKSENARLAKLAEEECFYFYVYYPKPNTLSNADSYDLPPPPILNPILRRTPDYQTFHTSCPYYVMDENTRHRGGKVLCKAVINDDELSSILCYDVSYLSKYAPPEVILFEEIKKWMKCDWKLYANGDIYYNVPTGLSKCFHYTNYLNEHHNIMRANLPQLCYAVIKLRRILSRVRRRIKIRLFIQNTHYNSSSPFQQFYTSQWYPVKKLIYDYIRY